MSEEKKPLRSAENLKRSKDRKPRRARALILLALAAALGFALFVLIRPQVVQQAEEDAGTSIVLIERDKTKLRSITVSVSGSEPYTLINQNDYDLSDKNDVLGEEYRVEGDPDFAVSTAQVLQMERYASDLTAKDLAARSPEDLDQYGLKQPGMTVTIGYRDDTMETLRFGGAVPTGSGYYLERSGDQAVYIVADSVYGAFHRALNDLKQTEQEKADLAAAQALEATAQPDTAAGSGATTAPFSTAAQSETAKPDATPAAGATPQPEATGAPTVTPTETIQPVG